MFIRKVRDVDCAKGRIARVNKGLAVRANDIHDKEGERGKEGGKGESVFTSLAKRSIPTRSRKVIDLAASLLTRCISILSACLRKLVSILAVAADSRDETGNPAVDLAPLGIFRAVIWKINHPRPRAERI